MAASISVVVPTYREADNLPRLIPQVAEHLTGRAGRFEILVVDDDSQDGTAEVCAELAAQHPLRLITRTDERDLATAVLRGFAEATGDILLVMDADLSHPPAVVPEMVTALENDAGDFVIGSRYVPGGSTDEGRGLLRWLNSRVATLLARPLTSAKDPMSGFFALRRATFEKAQALAPVGYKIGLELIVRCDCKRIVEIPIHFSRREFGKSKLDLRTRLQYVRHLGRLYAYRIGRLFKR